jgi:hypothetical protein
MTAVSEDLTASIIGVQPWPDQWKSGERSEGRESRRISGRKGDLSKAARKRRHTEIKIKNRNKENKNEIKIKTGNVKGEKKQP